MDIFPCTPLQAAMFGNTIEDKNAFVARLVYKADGKWSASQICEAWKKVIQKHDILRTCFVQAKGRVYQIVRPFVNLIPTQSKENIQGTLDEMKEIGITTELNNWISLTVVKPKDFETHVILQLHHCMYDGWSLNLLESDFYNFLSVETDLNLTERVSFKPFAQYIEGQDVEIRNEFWRKYLADISPPSIFIKPVSSIDKTTTISKTLPVTSKLLTDSAKLLNTTASTLMKLAWGLTLMMLSQSDDVVFAEIVSGRDVALPGIERYYILT